MSESVRESEALVSIVIPTYNGATWIRDAIGSALAQTHSRLEILVVDDTSTDETAEIVRGIDDERIRLSVNGSNLGLVANWNRCLALARGEYVKFLFQDDLLEPDCVTRMVDVMQRRPGVGMVFSRRHILVDEPDDPKVQGWLRHHSNVDRRFKGLGEINPGRELFDRAYRRRFRGNWVGEPTCVMVRASAIARVGGFNLRMVQTPDWEMWLRLMFYFDVGFIPAELASFRVHGRSMSAQNRKRRRWWMDHSWLVEGLREHSEIRSAYRRLGLLSLDITARATIKQLKRIATGHRRAIASPGSGLGAYVRHRLSRRGRSDRLHGVIDPPTPGDRAAARVGDAPR